MSDKEWYELPRPLGAAKLVALRDELRKMNLHDTEEPPLPKGDGVVPAEAISARTSDGTYNDVSCPMMGSAGTRFGRNAPLKDVFPDTKNLLTPNPRTVSQALFTRTTFQPVPFLNVLAAAWIQFQTHDWFVHKKGDPADSFEIPLADSDPWPEHPMKLRKTPVAPAPPGSKRPPAYVNENSHWWDGSQVYGSTREIQATVRTGIDGKVKVGDDGRLPVDPVTGLEITGLPENSWVALSLLHAVFAMEHNAICDRLKAAFPQWGDQKLFQQARLINAALMAKIHTVEWSTAILPQPLASLGLRTNWEGLLPAVQRLFPKLDDNDVISGIPGSDTDHHSAPYSLTEEFAAVYRMHSLMPDDFTFRSAATGAVLDKFELPALSGKQGRKLIEKFSPVDLLYSFGVEHPGMLRLHNFPKHLQNLVKDDGERFDLATVDILRDRERGVPRYNQFRRMVHKKPVTSFEEITDNPEWAKEIKSVYGGDLEKVDLLVGLMCEPLPEGMGFSDTAFRIFLLMASRRLKSDRFFSKDYGPDTYTEPGLEWIAETTMLDILRRHFPSLSRALRGIKTAFHPWNKVGE